jgi:hypothetical protein
LKESKDLVDEVEATFFEEDKSLKSAYLSLLIARRT